MNVSAPLHTGGWRPWARMGVVMLMLMVCVLLPFVVWGEGMDRAVPSWLRMQDADLWLAVLGIALLVGDVLLPLPSSVISVLLCIGLGPWWGGVCVAVGGWLSFVVGYGIGRLMPEARLRRWVGPALWDPLSDRGQRRALWWIAIARPLPVLAEVSALLAGVWRLSMPIAFAHAALSSAALGALYGGSVWFGRNDVNPIVAVLALLVLPVSTWLLHRIFVHRLASHAQAEISLSNDQEAL